MSLTCGRLGGFVAQVSDLWTAGPIRDSVVHRQRQIGGLLATNDPNDASDRSAPFSDFAHSYDDNATAKVIGRPFVGRHEFDVPDCWQRPTPVSAVVAPAPCRPSWRRPPTADVVAACASQDVFSFPSPERQRRGFTPATSGSASDRSSRADSRSTTAGTRSARMRPSCGRWPRCATPPGIPTSRRRAFTCTSSPTMTARSEACSRSYGRPAAGRSTSCNRSDRRCPGTRP